MKIEVGKYYKNEIGNKVYCFYDKMNLEHFIKKEHHYSTDPSNRYRFLMVTEDDNWFYCSIDGIPPMNPIHRPWVCPIISEWHDEPQKPMINGIEVKVGQWWEAANGYERVKISHIQNGGIFSCAPCYDASVGWDLHGMRKGDQNSNLIKLIEDVE